MSDKLVIFTLGKQVFTRQKNSCMHTINIVGMEASSTLHVLTGNKDASAVELMAKISSLSLNVVK